LLCQQIISYIPQKITKYLFCKYVRIQNEKIESKHNGRNWEENCKIKFNSIKLHVHEKQNWQNIDLKQCSIW
jgi:hypothetical protein